MELILYLLTGAIAGFSAGLLGIGGGLIIVPVLYFIFSAQAIPAEHVMHMALATSLATIVVTSIASSYAHHKKQAVIWPVVLLLSPGICLGAWLGGSYASGLDSQILKPIFGFFELLVALHLLSQYKTSQHTLTINQLSASSGGLIIGFVSAIVGIGGGTLTVPFLRWHNISIRKAVATSAACGFPIAVFGTTSYVYAGFKLEELPSATLGYVNLEAFFLIIITSILFAPLGAKVAHTISEKNLQITFGLLLLLIGIRMLMPLT